MTNQYSRFKDQPVIVIGSGIAGLLLSIELADAGCKVKLVTKGSLEQSNSAWAQGGLAAVTGANGADSKEQHLLDTIAAGDGLTDPAVAEHITADGAGLVHKLAKHGVAFDQSSLALEGGHRMARVLHTADSTGRTIIDALIKAALDRSNIEIIEHCFLKEILTDGLQADSKRVCGVVALLSTTADSDSREIVIEGRAVVLATGGLGQVYARTTNPMTATGDGIAAAYRAGAKLVDMEFVQFHPTALHLDGAPAFLISEAARGAGAVLLDKNGDRFAQLYHSAGELATRDIVSRAIHCCMNEQSTNHVWLDMKRMGEKKLLEQFPSIVAKLRSFGLDPAKEFVPVSPAAHYFMGGIYADEYGRTTLQNLFAIGECASTGLHGANRLASNSLLEGGVMALKLAEILSLPSGSSSAALNPGFANNKKLAGSTKIAFSSSTALDFTRFAAADPNYTPDSFDRESFRQLMLSNAGLVRTEDGLNEILRYGQRQSPPTVIDGSLHNKNNFRSGIESDATYLLGKLIAQAALIRRESRGAHWRQDYPVLDDYQYKSRLLTDLSGYQWMPITSVLPRPMVSVQYL